MIISILVVTIITVGLMVLPCNQLLPTILAQENLQTESTTGNTNESTTGNTTESSEEELQQSGTISRKGR
jgi:hypothetical protein